MFFKIKAGTTGRSIPIRVQDSTSTTGALLSGLTASTSGLTCKYRRQGQATEQTVALTASGVTLDTFTSGGFIADPILAGHYELQIPNAALQAGATYVVITLSGAANMVPLAIMIELDAVDYQDSTRFGLGAIPNVVQGNSGALPTGDASGRVTVIANQDKTGYSLTQTFPANFSVLSIDGNGQINSVGVVDELGPNALLANDLANEIGVATFSQLTTYAWPNNSLGKHILISNDNNRSVKVVGAGAGHVAADIHAIQAAVIVAGSFAANAIDANALASDAATEIATAVGNLQAISRLDSMIESNGAGQFRFDTIALSMAPGGGGGTTNITVEDRSITVV